MKKVKKYSIRILDDETSEYFELAVETKKNIVFDTQLLAEVTAPLLSGSEIDEKVVVSSRMFREITLDAPVKSKSKVRYGTK